MEHNKCKSRWDSNTQTDKCPFCGESLIEKASNLSIADALKIVIRQDGKDVLKSGGKVIAMVMDYAQGNEREKKLFKLACENGILNFAYEILNITDENQRKACINKYKTKLEYDALISQENAEMAIDVILEALEIEI